GAYDRTGSFTGSGSAGMLLMITPDGWDMRCDRPGGGGRLIIVASAWRAHGCKLCAPAQPLLDLTPGRGLDSTHDRSAFFRPGGRRSPRSDRVDARYDPARVADRRWRRRVRRRGRERCASASPDGRVRRMPDLVHD